jgi:acyl-CoA synthetase (AMP-forming)/AMP-acid ligase II
LNEQSDAFACALARRGVSAGDRVAVFLPNCPQFVIAFFGILKAGAVHVPVSPMFQVAELEHELGDSGARVVVTTTGLHTLVQAVLAATAVELVVTTAVEDWAPLRATLPVPDGLFSGSPGASSGLSLLDLLEEPVDHALLPAVGVDDIAAINYTGGTTGLPKGCIHTHRHIIYTAATTCALSLDLREGDAVLNFFPLYWIAGEDFGLVFPVFSGATCVLLSRWDPRAAAAAIDRYRIRIVNGLVETATDILALDDLGRYDLRCLEATLVSSFVQRVSKDLRARWKAVTGGALREASWGMTETHTWDAYTRGLDRDDFDLSLSPGFVGLPVHGTEFKITDFETGELKPLDTPGQLCVRTPSLFSGYWRHPEESAKAIRDGWLNTGDIGLIDSHGFIHYLGRRRDLIKSKGISVFPAEVESYIAKHPSVAAVGVVGVPDRERGELPVAYVELTSEVTGLDAQGLQAWCRERMAVYKVPQIRLLHALPKTSTGKIDKVALRQIALDRGAAT